MSDKIVDKKGNMIRYQTTAEAVREERQRIVGIIEKRMTVIGSDNINTSVDNVCGSLLSEIESRK